MTDEDIDRVARAIADRLFVNGAGNRATRLVLVKEDIGQSAIISNPRNLGGWSENAVTRQIREAIALMRCAENEGGGDSHV